MEPYLFIIITGVVALSIGLFIGNNIRKGINKTLIEEANREAKNLLQKATIEAEKLKNEKKLQAKEHFIELKSNHEREMHKRELALTESEKRAKKKRIPTPKRVECQF